MNNIIRRIIQLSSFPVRLKTKVTDRFKKYFLNFHSQYDRDIDTNTIESKYVPKVLFTSYCCSFEDEIIQSILQKWHSLNDSFEIKYFSDKDIERFFKEETVFYNIFSKLKNGVVKADFFRISYLNKYGGYWFDIDLEPFKVKLPKKGKIHLFDCGFGNISYMFIGGVKNKLFEKTLIEVSKRIINNLPNKSRSVMDISGPRVIQSILSEKLKMKLIDQNFIGRRTSKTFLEGTVYEFEYMRQNNGIVKSSAYEELQKKYKKKSYDDYDFI